MRISECGMRNADLKGRELPIIFNTEMVRAILDGRKTQTRRPIKNLPEHAESPRIIADKRWRFHYGGKPIKSPYKAGDLLYVRESARVQEWIDETCAIIKYNADEHWSKCIKWPDRIKPVPRGKCLSNGCFKEATRIWLKVTGVRVERVQEIAVKDALWEGQKIDKETALGCDRGIINTFKRLWNSIYHNWSENPWVWVFEFEVVSKCEMLIEKPNQLTNEPPNQLNT